MSDTQDKVKRKKEPLTRFKLVAMLHAGSTVSHPHHREAPLNTTLSLVNPEAALLLRILQAADPVARKVLSFPPLPFYEGKAPQALPVEGALSPNNCSAGRPSGEWMSARRDREVGMQCEQGWPRTILLRMSEAMGRRGRL